MLLVFGQPSPYDSAVVIRLPEYRKIRRRIMYGDQLDAGMQKQLNQANAQVDELTKAVGTLTATIQQKDKTIDGKDESIGQLRTSIEKYVSTESKTPWLKRPGVNFTLGSLAATAVILTVQALTHE